MNIDADIDIYVNLFNVAIICLLGYAGWRGYKKAAIIESIALFVFTSGLVISTALSRLLYNAMLENSDVPDLFSNLLLGLLLAGVLFLEKFVTKKVVAKVGDKTDGKYNKIIGAALSVIKYFLIIAVYCVVTYSIDCHSNFLPSGERKSKLARASRSTILTLFPAMKMEGNCVTITNNDSIDVEPKKDGIYDVPDNNF